MKILMIMPLFTGLKPVVHGNGKPVGMPDVYKLLEGLAKTNHEVYVIFMGTERNVAFTPKEVKERFFQNTLDSNINIMGIRLPFSGFFDRISGVKGPGQFNSTPGVLAFLKMPLKFYGLTMELYSLVRLARIVRHIKPSVIYGAAGWSMVAFLLGKLFRLATIKRQYGVLYFYPSLTKWQRLVHLADILSLRAPCDCIVMTNDGTRGDEVLRYFGITEHKIRFWLNGVDKEIYRPDFDKASFRQKWNIPSEDRIVLTVSRLANWKRVDRLLQAVPQVVNEMEKVKFLIVGDGPERHNLELMVAGLSISKYVKFTGFLNQQEVCECMNAADLFVSFYDVSNLCNPVLEAMACGKCVVSLDDDSLEEIIRDGENGILVKPSSVEEDLPGILVGLLEDDQKRLHLGKKAQEFALRNFDTWDERVEKEIRLIEEVACRRLAT